MIITASSGATLSPISIARKICTCEQPAILLRFPNLRHRDVADVLNMSKLHRDIGATFLAEKFVPKIAVNIARVNRP